jgi:mono/diheme cytochrome c family protein
MKRFATACAFILAGSPGPVWAQQGAPSLSATQLEGQRLFVQHCGLCHNKIQVNVPAPNGPVLTKAVLDNGNEAHVKSQIADGSPNMPGYKLMFEPAQIDALVDYIRTLNPPPAVPAPAPR